MLQNRFHMPELIGHSKIISYFQNLHDQNSLGQSYLFSGPARIGKRTVVSALIQSFLCTQDASDSLFGGEQTTNKLACEQCHSCKMILQGSHPDVLFVAKPEDKQNLSVELIRTAIQQSYRSAVMGERKYLVIDDADLMSNGASNALLKTLEEPPASCAIFLLSRYPARLPKTIISRCSVIEFTAISPDEYPGDLKLWQKSRQLPGNYQEFVHDETALSSLNEERELFIQFISTTPGKRLKIIETLFKEKKKTPSEQKKIWNERIELWKVLLRDLLMLKLQRTDLLFFTELSGLQFENLTDEKIITAQDQLSDILFQITTSTNLRLQLESFALHV